MFNVVPLWRNSRTIKFAESSGHSTLSLHPIYQSMIVQTYESCGISFIINISPEETKESFSWKIFVHDLTTASCWNSIFFLLQKNKTNVNAFLNRIFEQYFRQVVFYDLCPEHLCVCRYNSSCLTIVRAWNSSNHLGCQLLTLKSIFAFWSFFFFFPCLWFFFCQKC